MSNSYSMSERMPVAGMRAEARAAFITRTYMHLLGAILSFALIEIYLFQSGLAVTIARSMLSVSWLLVLGGFMIVGWIGSRDKEIRQIIDILSRRRKNNPILVGEAGVGKTAVVEGLTLRSDAANLLRTRGQSRTSSARCFITSWSIT